jgi:hypothetical protein
VTTPANLNTIAIDVVGHYVNTAKHLVTSYRAGTERALNAWTTGYERLVDKQALPWVTGDIKTNLLASQQRFARFVAGSVARIAERTESAVDNVSGRTVQGLKAFDKQTEWAHDLMLVNALRKVNLPVAKLSLRVAGRVDDASRRLSQRVTGSPVAKATRSAKRAVKRARRATRTA